MLLMIYSETETNTFSVVTILSDPGLVKSYVLNLYKSSQLPGEVGHLSPLSEMRKPEAQRGKILCPGPPSRSGTEWGYESTYCQIQEPTPGLHPID